MKICENMLGCTIKHLELVVNSHIIELFTMKKIQCPLKEGMSIKIPFSGFIESYSRITSTVLHTIGAYSYNHAAFNRPDIVMGRYCSVSNVRFMRDSHPMHLISSSPLIYEEGILKQARTTHIANDVWIADNVLIKSGVSLGNGCVVGANAVVTKDVPAYAIVVGNPAKIIKYRFDEEVRARLLQMKWWQYNLLEFKKISWKLPINAYLDELEKLIEKREIQAMNPEKISFEELQERALKKGSSVSNAFLYGAPLRVQSHLSYKLGKAMIEHSKSAVGILKLPFILLSVHKQHKKESICKNSKLPSLNLYRDYEEALKIQNYLSYKLGAALIAAKKRGFFMGGGDCEISFLRCA
ncbi:CatB-related O-acetyltransferase [Campylobacter sp. MIT 21-1684]|uniref:CatB-related O-acetyltransferase n=1 Tax=Campylobacter sp. MIT 21-1684 TaxID=2994322 RepID=UPI002B061F8E|nr:CatB-related O-acetyltransferase [Campylobacter sp. MIT 21-1684]